MKMEPLIHSHITDVLPDSHPLAFESVFCKTCGEMVHAFNNECMQTWVESGAGSHCIGCFATDASVLEDEFALNLSHRSERIPPGPT